MSAESLAVVHGRLHWLLNREEIGVNELAARSKLPPSTVKDVFSGKTELSLRVMVHLVEGFGLRSLDELIAPLGTSQLRRFEFGPEVVA